jgi:hypothetical protein
VSERRSGVRQSKQEKYFEVFGMEKRMATALDKAGATASFVCAIHCLAMPFVIGVLPILGLSFLADERVEWALIGFTVCVGLFSLLPSYFRIHKKWHPLAMFGLGFAAILFVKVVFEESSRAETPGMVFGALMIAASNFANRRLCHTCPSCADHEH